MVLQNICNATSPEINFADEFDRVARELDRAISQSTRAHHLEIHADRVGAKAGNLLFRAVDEGLLPPALRPLAWSVALIKQPRNEDHALGHFRLFVISYLKFKFPFLLNPSAGNFGLTPPYKKDENGYIIGRSGKRLQRIETGKFGDPDYTMRLSEDAATVADDYDEQDTLEHLRARTMDDADACRALSKAFRMHTEDARSGQPSSKLASGTNSISGLDGMETMTLPSSKEAKEDPPTPFQIHEETFSIKMNDIEVRFDERIKTLFCLLKCICDRPGCSVYFESMRAKGSVWGDSVIEDSSIKSAISRLKKKLRQGGLDTFANAIHTGNVKNKLFVMLRLHEICQST